MAVSLTRAGESSMIQPVIGTLAGSYKITDLINVGGMGSVYRAEHTLIGRIAAVKVLHPEMSASRDIVNRFFNEARVTTSIKHPGIVEVYDFGYLESGHAYLVMEFLEGAPLATRNKQRGPVGEGEAAAILKGVCSALAAAHAKGVVHRDLKPDNIFMVPDPEASLGVRPKLLDFGIAKLTEPGLASSATKTGAVMGTPTYMSPEQCRGTGDVDHRADLYSIGCMFYEMLAGRPPFVDRGAGELIGAHLFVNPEPPSRYVQGISPDTEALVMSLLAKQPAQRPQTALELGQRLAQISQRTGWGSSTSWEQRPSVASMQAQASAQHLTPGSFTPAPQFTPVHPTPGHFTPAHPTPFTPSNAPTQHAGGMQPHYTPAFTPAPTQPPSEKPTTLSGAASHSIAQTPKRGNKWLIPAVALVALVGGGIAIAAIMGGGKKDEHAASAPAESSSTKKMTSTPDTPKTDTAKTAAPNTTKPSEATAAPDTTKSASDPATAETDATKSATDTAKTATGSTTVPGTTASDATNTASDATKTATDATKTATDATKTAADATKTPATNASSTSKAVPDPTKTSHTKTADTAKTPDTSAAADPSKTGTAKTATKKSTTKKAATKKDPTSDPLLETDL